MKNLKFLDITQQIQLVSKENEIEKNDVDTSVSKKILICTQKQDCCDKHFYVDYFNKTFETCECSEDYCSNAEFQIKKLSKKIAYDYFYYKETIYPVKVNKFSHLLK